MKVTVSVDLSDDLIPEGVVRNNFLKRNINKLIKIESDNVFKIERVQDDSGKNILEVEIDRLGVVNVIGGVCLLGKKPGEETYQCIVDEGASEILFEFNGDKSYFCGALNGLENSRYLETKEGSCFRYRYKKYLKLSREVLVRLFDSEIKYKYSIKR